MTIDIRKLCPFINTDFWLQVYVFYLIHLHP